MTWFKRITATIAALVLLTLLALWIFSPLISRTAINHLLQPYAMSLTDDSRIRLNPFRSVLRISQLKLTKAQTTPLTIKHLELHYSITRLLFKEVRVSKLALTGLALQGEYDQDRMMIAGFELNTSDESGSRQNGSKSAGDSSADSTVSEASPAADNSDGLLYLAPDIELRDLTLSLAYLGHWNSIVIDHLSIVHSRYQHGVADSALSGKLTMNDAPITIDANLHYQANNSSGHVTLALSHLQLAQYQYLLPEDLGELAGQLAIDIDLELHQTRQSVGISKGSLSTQLDDLVFHNATASVSVQHYQLSLQQLALELRSSGTIDTSSQIETQLDQLSVKPAGAEDTLLSLTHLQMEPADFSFKSNDISFVTPVLSLSGLTFSAADATAQPAIASVEQIKLEQLSYLNQLLTLDRIGIGATDVHVRLTEQGVANLVQLPSAASDQQTAEAVSPDSAVAETKTDQTALAFRLGRIENSEPLTIDIEDETQVPVFRKQFTITELTVDNIDSSDADQSASYALALKDNDYFNFKLTGDAQPFKQKVNANIKASLSEFSLPEVNSYLARTLDFEFKAGQLDTDFSGTIRDSDIDSVANVTIRGADFSASQNQDDSTNVIGQTAIPLNVALGMLKDSHGDIHLKVPVKGAIDDPSFGMQYILGLVVKKAAMNQAKNYLINTFVPYAQVVKVSMAAGSYALKVRFEDLPYTPGQIEVAAAQQVFVEQLARLMTDKPALRVKICPVVTPADIEATAPLDETQQGQLMSLANDRAASFKASVLQLANVESSRLLLCMAKVAPKADAQSRLEFSSD